MKRTLKMTLLALWAPAMILTMVGCGGQVSLTALPAGDLFEKAMTLYESEKYLEAIPNFQAVVYNYPGASMVDSAQYFLALSYYGQQDYQLATVEFNRLMQNYPSSVFSENSQFMKAVCLFDAAPGHYGLDQTDLAEAVMLMEDFVVDHPESEMVSDAHTYIREARTRLARKVYDSGVIYTRIRAYKAAKIYFQQVVDDYTDTEYGPLATLGIAECDFRQREYGKAREQFSNFLKVFPDHIEHERAAEMLVDAAF
ncbi:MAG: outer membrane protein assembly factor BamD, partial [candidate division Zixibacteria bacterium]